VSLKSTHSGKQKLFGSLQGVFVHLVCHLWACILSLSIVYHIHHHLPFTGIQYWELFTFYCLMIFFCILSEWCTPE